MLTHKDENDYVLNEGEFCWITVGDTSVYISNNSGWANGQRIKVYKLGHEMENPLETILLESLQ